MSEIDTFSRELLGFVEAPPETRKQHQDAESFTELKNFNTLRPYWQFFHDYKGTADWHQVYENYHTFIRLFLNEKYHEDIPEENYHLAFEYTYNYLLFHKLAFQKRLFIYQFASNRD